MSFDLAPFFCSSSSTSQSIVLGTMGGIVFLYYYCCKCATVLLLFLEGTETRSDGLMEELDVATTSWQLGAWREKMDSILSSPQVDQVPLSISDLGLLPIP